jgi:hypothetical protein
MQIKMDQHNNSLAVKNQWEISNPVFWFPWITNFAAFFDGDETFYFEAYKYWLTFPVYVIEFSYGIFTTLF